MASTAGTTFEGFDGRALSFYAGLEADNSKTYWNDHREVYEESVRRPLLALLNALEPRFGPGKLFRPHRDLRFSADKSPYKTHAGAIVGPAGDAGWYLQIGAQGLLVGGGYYTMSPDQLSRYRAAVTLDTPGEVLAGIVADLEHRDFVLAGEKLARSPRGIAPDHPRLDLLRHKGLAAMRPVGDPAWLESPTCLHRVTDLLDLLRPLDSWLTSYVGPAQVP